MQPARQNQWRHSGTHTHTTLTPKSNLIADLDHNCTVKDEKNQRVSGRGKFVILNGCDPASGDYPPPSDGKCLPTFIQHQVLWNFELWRPLAAVDMARAHSWPMGLEEESYVGASISIADQLASQQLSHRCLISMIGDSWALRPQGMLLMWLLANLETVHNINGPPLKKMRPSSVIDYGPDDDCIQDVRQTVSVSSSDDDAYQPLPRRIIRVS